MRAGIRTTLIVIALATATARGQELMIFDDEVTITEAHNGFYYFDPPQGSPGDWLSPYDYYNGKFFVRYEVIGYPSGAPLILNVCIWSDVTEKWASFKETCSPGVDVDVNNPYYIETSPVSWWKKSGVAVDFSRVKDFKRLGLVLFCERWKNISPWVPDSLSCWNRREDYLPLQVRFTIICVAHGYQFSGWHENGFSTDAGAHSPSGLEASLKESNGVELKWKDNSDTEQGFIIDRSLFSTRGFEEIASVDKDVTTYFDPDVDNQKTYYYRVRRNGLDANDYTNVAPIGIPKREKSNTIR